MFSSFIYSLQFSSLFVQGEVLVLIMLKSKLASYSHTFLLLSHRPNHEPPSAKYDVTLELVERTVQSEGLVLMFGPSCTLCLLCQGANTLLLFGRLQGTMIHSPLLFVWELLNPLFFLLTATPSLYHKLPFIHSSVFNTCFGSVFNVYNYNYIL